MAIYGVGKTKVKVQHQDASGTVRDLVVIGDVTIKRTANEPSSVSMTVRRNNLGAFTPENGEIVTVSIDDGHDMIWAYITETKKYSNLVDITAYDQLWYLSQNTYTQNYGTLSASDLYIRMADDFGFKMVQPPTVEDTKYKIPDVILQNAKPIDIMVDALNITFDNTGERYYIYDAFNNLSLSRSENDQTLKVDTLVINHYNMKGYNYTEDINDMRNVIKAETQEEDEAQHKVIEASDPSSVNRYGRLEFYTTVEDGENPETVANELLEEKNVVNATLSCSDVIGEPRVWGGSAVYVDLYSNGLEDQRELIRGWFCVDSVTHKLSNGTHYMDLELKLIRMDDNW